MKVVQLLEMISSPFARTIFALASLAASASAAIALCSCSGSLESFLWFYDCRKKGRNDISFRSKSKLKHFIISICRKSYARFDF